MLSKTKAKDISKRNTDMPHQLFLCQAAKFSTKRGPPGQPGELPRVSANIKNQPISTASDPIDLPHNALGHPLKALGFPKNNSGMLLPYLQCSPATAAFSRTLKRVFPLMWQCSVGEMEKCGEIPSVHTVPQPPPQLGIQLITNPESAVCAYLL